MKTASKYVIIFDVESGGLPGKENRPFYEIALIEGTFCVIDMESLEIIEELDIMLPDEYKEGLIYQEQAEMVHGITKAIRQANGKPLKECYKSVLDLYKKYKNPRQGITMVAHNYNFDKPFLENFFEYMGGNLSDHVKYWLDTMQFAHMAALEQVDYKLHTCCGIHNIDLVDAHRSSADTRATAKLFIEFVKRLRGEGLSAAAQVEKKIRYREKFQF